MSHQHSASCSHGHDNGEMDPCMAQEIAQAEKHRILYEKLKTQSDRMLMGLNLRTSAHRTRASVAPLAEDCQSASSDDEVEPSDVLIETILPSEFASTASGRVGRKVLTLLAPCDWDPKANQAAWESLHAEFRLALRKSKSPDDVSALILSKLVCVCNKCPDKDSRAGGSMRSILMLLKSNPSVLVTRGGGMLGFWTTGDASTLTEFIALTMSQFKSLIDQISLNQVECLNEDPENPVANLFNSNPATCLRSDIDPQLLISIPFVSPVKLSGIRFRFSDTCTSRPSSVKLFINQLAMGFSDAESMAPLQTITLEELQSDKAVALRYVLFQNVVSLQIFVDTCEGDSEQTEIGGIEIFGTVGESMNMKEFKKIKDDE